jgi:hypothetical protein
MRCVAQVILKWFRCRYGDSKPFQQVRQVQGHPTTVVIVCQSHHHLRHLQGTAVAPAPTAGASGALEAAAHFGRCYNVNMCPRQSVGVAGASIGCTQGIQFTSRTTASVYGIRSGLTASYVIPGPFRSRTRACHSVAQQAWSLDGS